MTFSKWTTYSVTVCRT